MNRILAFVLLMVMLTACAGVQAEEKTVTLNLDAIKYLDNENPGKVKFAFKVWELTDEQMRELFDIRNLLSVLPKEENPLLSDDDVPDTPVIEQIPLTPPDLSIKTEDESIGGGSPSIGYIEQLPVFRTIEIVNPLSKLTNAQITKIADALREKLDKLPYTIVYNSGKAVDFADKTYTEEDIGGKNFVITEIHDPSKPFIYDHAVYAYSVDVVGVVTGIVEALPINPRPGQDVGFVEATGGIREEVIEKLEEAIPEIEERPRDDIEEAIPEIEELPRDDEFDDIEEVIPEPGNGKVRLLGCEIYCISPERGMYSESSLRELIDPVDHFIFSNYSRNDLPETGDSMNFVFLVVLAAVGMIGMTVILRKKKES